jgi:hypothetical protein
LSYAKLIARGALLAAALCAECASARAQSTQYTYAGQDYTQIDTGTCLTTSMGVSFTMTLSAPLAPNTNYPSLAPTLWLTNDGVHKWKNSTKGSSASIAVKTGKTGAIEYWNISTEIIVKNGPRYFMRTENVHKGAVFDVATDYVCQPAAEAENDDLPGSWAIAR